VGDIESVEQWKYDWLDWYKMFITDFATLQTEESISKVEECLEILEQFERTTKELKEWGTLSEVMTKLEGNGKDIDLLSQLEEIKKDGEAMMMLENLWQDEGLMEIGTRRDVIDRRFRELLRKELHRLQNRVWCGFKGGEEELRHHTFACFRRLRDTTGPVRSGWLILYREHEEIRRRLRIEYTEDSPEQAWLAWAKAKGELGIEEVLLGDTLVIDYPLEVIDSTGQR
jgi:hypothetical protein